MSIRTNTNPRPLELPPEMRDILARNGMRGHIAGSSEGFVLIVQGHDSPLLSYPITEKQLQALTDWGTNYANRKCYNTFASIVAADFDLPKDFVHARNANGRVAMGLHGYRIGAGEYGRLGRPFPLRHPWGPCFLGWTPRQQDGFHLRRIGGNLYFPGAPIVPNRPDGRMKPGELQSGGYGFYYKGHPTTVVAGQDVLEELETVITPLQPRPRPTEPAKPYHTLITSPVYFTNEKWQECLASHGILIDSESKTMTIQSSSVSADLQYDLTDEELAALANNSAQEVPVEKRLEIINGIIKEDFSASVTMDMLNSDKMIAIELHPAVKEDLDRQLSQVEQIEQGGQRQYVDEGLSVVPEERELPKGTVVMDGNDLAYITETDGLIRLNPVGGFTTTVVLHRQVAGVYVYVKDIPQRDEAKTLCLTAACDNDGLVLGEFDSEDYGQGKGTGKKVVNGTAPKEDIGNDTRSTVCSINFTQWKDATTGQWKNPYDETNQNPAFVEGSYFVGSFVIPFAAPTQATGSTEEVYYSLQLELLGESDKVLKTWPVLLSDQDPQVSAFTRYTWNNTKFKEENITETREAYSLLRNHLYCIGSKDTDGDTEDDEPLPLSNANEIILKAVADWDVIYDMELEPER